MNAAMTIHTNPTSAGVSSATPIVKKRAALRDKLGICQWFHYNDDEQLERAVAALKELGVKHLRTGISWADFHRPGGKAWYDRQMKALRGFDILLSVWHTPPSRSEGRTCNSPPRRLRDYADFIDQVMTEYGDGFTHLELWNEPNNRLKWNFESFDPQWRKFGEMIAPAAAWARRRGKSTVLGGMIPVDPHWLALMEEYGVLEHIDIIAIHAFPGMWWPGRPNWDWYAHWNGWADKVRSLSPIAADRPIWVTETGLATWDLATTRPAKYDLQSIHLRRAADAPVDHLYWYSLMDLSPQRQAIEGFHVDENEYHMGLITHDGHRKPAFHQFQNLLNGFIARPREGEPARFI